MAVAADARAGLHPPDAWPIKRNENHKEKPDFGLLHCTGISLMSTLSVFKIGRCCYAQNAQLFHALCGLSSPI